MPSVSSIDAARIDLESYRQLHEVLEQDFPLVHRTLTREQINEFAVLYTWDGTDTSLDPIALTAHWDVVPVEEDSIGKWTHPPFSGHLDGEFVWGRGTLDDKISIIAILESVESLLAEGFTPRRTVLLCFGGDEEITGYRGAAVIARTIRERGQRLHYLLDEGAVVADGMLPGVQRPLALIGIAEKGHVNVGLSAEHSGGHASMPPPRSAAGIISAGVRRIERNPFPPRLTYATRMFLHAIAPEARRLRRFLFSNTWLSGKLILSFFTRNVTTNALVRTTQAVTMLQGSDAPNVLPLRASATINIRILHGDTISSVLKRLRRVVNDARIKIEVLPGSDANDPVPSTRTDSDTFKAVRNTIEAVFPEALCIPFLVTGSTDSKHYAELTGNIYRFLPVVLRPKDLSLIHSSNERISHTNVARAVEFYTELLRRTAGHP